MGDAATPALPDFTSQTASVYKANIDAGFAVADRLGWAFAPHEQATPDMTLRLEAGAIFDGATLTEVAAQDTAVITAPSVNPRIDRVVIDRGTGAVSVVTGTEAASPTPPAVPAGKVPVAQVALVVSQSEIVNADITDERALGLPGGPITTRGDVIRGDTSGNPERLAVGTADQVLTTDGADILWGPAPGFAAGTKMLFRQTAAPTGWTKEMVHNDKTLRLTTGTITQAGSTAFSNVFGSGKTTGSASPGSASHSHQEQRYNSGAGTGLDVSAAGKSTSLSTLNMPSTVADGAGSSHNHTLSLDVTWVDVIIAIKD